MVTLVVAEKRMLVAPGRSSEPSRENFEKAVVMMTASIAEWVDHQKREDPSAAEDDESLKKSQLLLQATDHLRQYGIMGARTAGFVALTVATLWAQSQFRIGRCEESELKSQMLWVMQSPAVQAAIQETFKPLDDESKRDAQNFARGSEGTIVLFVSTALEKYSSMLKGEGDRFIENNLVDLKELSGFFAAIDEGGLSYLAKVLELALVTTMNCALFSREFRAENSFYFSGTIELIGEVLGLEVSV